MHKLTHGLFFGISLFFLFLLMGNSSYSQDSLRLKTGAVYSVRIIEISDIHVKYRTYSNPDGPLYTISKNTVDQYKLEGKRWEYFYDTPGPKKSPAPATKPENFKHSVSFNVIDLIRTDLTVFYDIEFTKKIGIRIPVTYGFRSGYFNPISTLSNPFGFQRNLVFKTGVDLRIYSGEGLRKVRFVFGPGIYYMRLNRLIPDFVTTSQTYMAYKTGSSLRLMFLTGMIVKPTDRFQFGFDGGFGGDIDINEPAKVAYTMGAPTVPKVQFNVYFGYKF